MCQNSYTSTSNEALRPSSYAGCCSEPTEHKNSEPTEHKKTAVHENQRCVPLQLFRPSYRHVKLPVERVREHMQMYGGDWFSYTHQHKSHYHFEMEGLGLVSYVWARSTLGRSAVVVGDPLAPSVEAKTKLLEAFNRQVPGMKHYLLISESTAEVLHGLGFSRTQFGTNYYIDIQKWKLPSKNSLRRYQKQGRNEGLVAKEQAWADVDAEVVRRISNTWLGGKSATSREAQFITWPFYEGDEWASRKFYCYDKEGTMLAFIWWTPCFRDGRVVGQCGNILRRDPKLKPSHSLDFLVMECIEKFRQEGLEYVTLAPAALHCRDSVEGQSALLKTTFDAWIDCPIKLYQFQGNGKHKDHFKANRIEKVYTCTKGARAHLCAGELILTVTDLLPLAKVLHGVSS